MATIDFKQGQPENVGSEINILGRKYIVLSCDLTKAYLGFGFGIDQYHIVAQEAPNNDNATAA